MFTLEHPQPAIKSENDKHLHFPSHAIGKPQLDSKQIIDVRNSDGQIVHVNIEDINQFLTYHEVFGKISGAEQSFPPNSGAITIPTLSAPMANAANQPNSQIPPGQLVVPKIEQIPNQGYLRTQAPHSVPAATPHTAPTPIPHRLIQRIMEYSHRPTSSAGAMMTSSSSTTSAAANLANNDSAASINNDSDSAAMPSPAMHTCDICGKVFPFKYQYIVHRRYHNERKQFVCQVCGQAFATSLDLTAHGKIHDGVKMFMCNVCYNVFANDASLERHMKRHSTDKPFGCTVCQKTFARKEHLDNHFRSHSGETPFR